MMADVLKNQRFWLLSVFFLFALVLLKKLGLPDTVFMLVLVALVPLLLLGWSVFLRAIQSPLLPFLGLLLMFFLTVFEQSVVSIKSHVMAFGFGLFYTIYFLNDHFSRVWAQPFIRNALIFVGIAGVYFLFYASDFQLSQVKAGYPIDFEASFSNAPAKTIGLLGMMGLTVALIVGYAAGQFQKTREQLEAHWQWLSLTMIVGTFAYFGLLVLNRFKGGGIYSPMIALFLWGLWSTQGRLAFANQWTILTQLPKWSISNLLVMAMGLMLLATPLTMNKTGLVGTALTFGLLAYLCWRLKLPLGLAPVWQWLNQGVASKVLALGALLLAVAGLAVSGLMPIITEKIDYYLNGFSKLSTLSIRTGNWHYFFQDWADTLSLKTLLFGYGIGASRESIFFISAMRQAGDRTLVQTLHNSYLEFLYDYGMLSLIYFGIYATLLMSTLKTFVQRTHQGAVEQPLVDTQKLWGIVSVCLLLFMGIYAMLDGIRVQLLIQLFAMLGWIEGLKTALAKPAMMETR